MRATIVVILIILSGWWLADKAYKELYLYAEKKPFWTGTEEVQVCKAPDYGSKDCKRFNVELVDGKHARIYYSVTKRVKEQSEGVPTDEEFRKAYARAMIAGDAAAAEMIKDANAYLHPDKDVLVKQQFDVFDLECKFGSTIKNQPRFVVCNGQDKNGQEWDFLPVWVNIN